MLLKIWILSSYKKSIWRCDSSSWEGNGWHGGILFKPPNFSHTLVLTVINVFFYRWWGRVSSIVPCETDTSIMRSLNRKLWVWIFGQAATPGMVQYGMVGGRRLGQRCTTASADLLRSHPPPFLILFSFSLLEMLSFFHCIFCGRSVLSSLPTTTV
jgi:hypothetical protein